MEKIKKLENEILRLENVLYKILEAPSIDSARELSADALGEDLSFYDETEDYGVSELDFDVEVYS